MKPTFVIADKHRENVLQNFKNTNIKTYNPHYIEKKAKEWGLVFGNFRI